VGPQKIRWPRVPRSLNSSLLATESRALLVDLSLRSLEIQLINARQVKADLLLVVVSRSKVDAKSFFVSCASKHVDPRKMALHTSMKINNISNMESIYNLGRSFARQTDYSEIQ